jgi:hypothetical protein
MRNNTLSRDEILRNFFCLYNQDCDEKDKVNGIRDLDLASNPALANSLSEAGFEAEVKARLAEQELSAVPKTIDDTFDRSAKTTKTPPKIGPDELGNAETRGHQLVEPSGTGEEPTVEIDFENDDCVFAVGGNEDELDAIPTRLAARLPASPDEPTLRELELSDFEEEEDVNVGTTPPPIPLPAAVPQPQPPATLLGNSWSQEAPTTPRAPALQQKRRAFNSMTLHDLVLVLGVAIATVVLGTTFFELGRNRERSFWQKLFAERPVIAKTCGEPKPVVVYLNHQPPSRADARIVEVVPVQKSLPKKIRRPTTVVRRQSPPSRPVVVEVPAVMGTYPLPPAGDSRESVLATLKRACGSDPKWITSNRERLSEQNPTTISTVCRRDMADRLPKFVPVGGYPQITLKIRQS